MARSFTQVYCSIWDDPDFCALGAGAQRTYLMLITQGDITACGSLALTLRRWSNTCTEKALSDWLAELVDAGYVLIDEDTEELFVRTFAKHDGGYRNPLRRKAVISTARAIRSRSLRSTAVDELGKLGVSIALETAIEGPSNAIPTGVEGPSVPVTLSDHSKDPEPGKPERGTVADESDDESSPFCPPHQPNGPDGKPCTRCADRGKARKHAAERGTTEHKSARAAVLAAIAACPRCNAEGFVEGPDHELLGKCGHSDARLRGVG